jgi:hypothetical protein
VRGEKPPLPPLSKEIKMGCKNRPKKGKKKPKK